VLLPQKKWGQAPFCKKDKWGLAPFIPGTIYSQGFALLSSGEKPCPLSLSHGFSPYNSLKLILAYGNFIR